MIVNASDLYVSIPLTNVSIATTVDTTEFVAGRLFPVVKVNKQSAKYWEYPRGQWFRSAAQVRGPGQESAGTSWKVLSKDAYYCNVYALHVDIDDFARANAMSNFNLDAESVRFLQTQILLKREYDFLSGNFVTGKWATDVTPTTKWNQANSTPFKDIRAQMTATKLRTGKRPNKIVFQEQVWDALQDNADLLDRIKGGATTGDPARVTRQQVAAILELDEVLVSGAIQNTAIEGQTDNFSFAPGQHALLLYSPPAPGLMTLTAGYTFVWTDLFGVGPDGERVLKFRMEELRSDRVEAEANWDHRILGSDLGVFFHDCLA